MTSAKRKKQPTTQNLSKLNMYLLPRPRVREEIQWSLLQQTCTTVRRYCTSISNTGHCQVGWFQPSFTWTFVSKLNSFWGGCLTKADRLSRLRAWALEWNASMDKAFIKFILPRKLTKVCIWWQVHDCCHFAAKNSIFTLIGSGRLQEVLRVIKNSL